MTDASGDFQGWRGFGSLGLPVEAGPPAAASFPLIGAGFFADNPALTQWRIFMRSAELTCEDLAEIMRKKDRYRQLILSGRISLPYQEAAQLLGPDCLYHLYAVRAHEARRKKGRSR